MEATDDEVATSVDAASAVDDTAESTVDDESAADDSEPWSPTTCPSCGNGVLMEVVTGPTEARLSPCGCRVAPGYLHRRRD